MLINEAIDRFYQLGISGEIGFGCAAFSPIGLGMNAMPSFIDRRR